MPVSANPIFTQTGLSIDPIIWTDVVAPAAFDLLTLIGPTDASIFVRGGAGQGEVEVMAGVPYRFGGVVEFGGFIQRRRLPRFAVGDVVVQVRSASGTGPVTRVWE